MTPSWGTRRKSALIPADTSPQGRRCLPGRSCASDRRALAGRVLKRKNAMRRTEAAGWLMQDSSIALRRALRLAVVVVGIALVMTAGAARAEEDDEDDKTFEEKIIEGIMAGIGGTNMDNRGIDYRERSPLVVPPKLDLRPPEAAKTEIKDPNWPKDPDEQRRKAAIAARKKENKDPLESSRVLTPSELNARKTAAARRSNGDPIQPGISNNPSLSPSQLGFTGGLSQIFGGGN